MSEHTVDIQKELKRYYFLFGGLLIFTLIAVGLTYLQLNRGQALLFAVSLALVKIIFVVSFFRQMIESKKSLHIIVLLTFVLVLALIGLMFFEFHSLITGTTHVA